MRHHLALLMIGAAMATAAPTVATAARAAPIITATAVFSQAGGEPNVTASPSGRYVLVDGVLGRGGAGLYRSTDYGRHFTAMSNAPRGNGGDFDMHFIDEHTVVGVNALLGIEVGVSRDAGATWTTSTVGRDSYDRPWIGAKGNDLYVIASNAYDVPLLYSSHDLGKTFDPLPIPLYGTGTLPAEAGGTAPTPVDALVDKGYGYVDNMIVDPNTGDVYVLYAINSAESYAATSPVGAPTRLYVAHLENGAMVSHPVTPGAGSATDAFGAGLDSLTEDAAGTLYVLGNGKHDGGQGVHQTPWLSYSKDKGKTWSRLLDVGTPGRTSVFGAIAGGARGDLALVYYEGSTRDDSNHAQNWYATMAWITKADTAKPYVVRDRVIAKPVHNTDICKDGFWCGQPGFGTNRNLLEYIDDMIGPDGKVRAVFSSDGPATGVADSSARAVPVSVILVRQLNGPSLGKGVIGT